MNDLNKLPLADKVRGDFGIFNPLNAWTGAGNDVLVYSMAIGHMHLQLGWTKAQSSKIMYRTRAETGDTWTAWAELGAAVAANIKRFNYILTTTAPPLSGELRCNQSRESPASVTTLWISDTDIQAGAVGALLGSIVAGTILRIESNANPTVQWQQYIATGPAVAETAYHSVPVQWMDGGQLLIQEWVDLSVI